MIGVRGLVIDVQERSIKDYSPVPVRVRAPSLVVAGVVGPVAHAQGPSAGRRSSIIQMGGCNLTCSWCDAAFTWDAVRYDLSREVGYWPVTEIVETALACAPAAVVISGGEPLIQQNSAAFTLLLDSMPGQEIGLETNGTIAPAENMLNRVSWVTVSPKLAHSGDPAWARIVGNVLVEWGQRAQHHDIDFSFAVRDAEDVTTAAALVTIHGLPADRVWIVPEGVTATTAVDRLREVSESTLDAGFNLSVRLNALTALTTPADR
jgi:organic radical activating enzyme